MLAAQASPRSPGSGAAGTGGRRLDRRASVRGDPLLESLLPALLAWCTSLLTAADQRPLWALATPERVAKVQALADEVLHEPSALAQACLSSGCPPGGEMASQLSASGDALGQILALVEQDARFSGSALCYFSAGERCLLRHEAVGGDAPRPQGEEVGAVTAPPTEPAPEPGTTRLVHLGTAKETNVPQPSALRCVSDSGAGTGGAVVVAVDLARVRRAVADAERARLEAKAELFAAAPPLSALPDGVRARMAKAAAWQVVSYGTRLCAQGKAAYHIFIVSAGAVRLSRTISSVASHKGRGSASLIAQRSAGARHVEFSALHRPAVLCADLALHSGPCLSWCTVTAHADRVELLAVPAEEARRVVASAPPMAQREFAERCREVAASRQGAFDAAAAVVLPEAGLAAAGPSSCQTPVGIDHATIRSVVDEVNSAETADAAGGLLGGSPIAGAAASGEEGLPGARSPVPPSSQRWIRSRRLRMERHDLPAFAMDSPLRRAALAPAGALPLCATAREPPSSPGNIPSSARLFLERVRRETARASRRRAERARNDRPSPPALLASPQSPRARSARVATARGRSPLEAGSPRPARPSSPRVVSHRRRELATRRDRRRDKLRRFGLAHPRYGLAAAAAEQERAMESPLRARMERWVETIEHQPIRGAYYQCDDGGDLLD